MISIIIPTYNESKNIEGLINFLKKHSQPQQVEIIVADGGSTDDTIAKAKAAGAQALLAPSKGRAAQMNYGASFAKGSYLYFIHADCFPAETFVKDIQLAVENGFLSGRYKTRFDNNNLLLKFNAFFTRFNWMMCDGGDQTFFINAKLFKKLNGFKNEMRIMEDYELTARAKQSGPYCIMPGYARVSARKYESNSWFKVQKANYSIVQMYKNNATQTEMAEAYKKMLDYR